VKEKGGISRRCSRRCSWRCSRRCSRRCFRRRRRRCSRRLSAQAVVPTWAPCVCAVCAVCAVCGKPHTARTASWRMRDPTLRVCALVCAGPDSVWPSDDLCARVICVCACVADCVCARVTTPPTRATARVLLCARGTKWARRGGARREEPACPAMVRPRPHDTIRGKLSFKKQNNFLSRNKTIKTIHNSLQAFLQLLEFRIIGSAEACMPGDGSARPRPRDDIGVGDT
jgi:hypothetical protein